MANPNNDVIMCIVTALVIVVVVHFLFGDSRCMRYIKDQVGPRSNSIQPQLLTEMFEDNLSTKAQSNSSDATDQWRSLNFEKVTVDSPEPHNDKASFDYLTKQLIGGPNSVADPGCPPPAKSRDQFHKDFFGFRDMTCNNTSIRVDPVDQIQQLYLQGNLSQARRYPNLKIKDLFDQVTAGPKEYTRQCVRLPAFDDINTPGYQMSFGQQPMALNGDSWSYPNEKIINGGLIKPGLRGADPYDNFNLDLRMLDQNLEVNYGHKM